MRLALLPLLSLSLSAQPYSVKPQTIDGHQVVVLRDEAAQTEVRVAPAYGMNSYSMTVNGQPVFWTPAPGSASLLSRPGFFGNPFLWPWANRIDGTSYFVNGKKYSFDLDYGNVRPGPNNTPMHGLVAFDKRWKVKSAAAGKDQAALTAVLEFWRYPDLMAQFPFAHEVEMTYRLRGTTLDIETLVRNLSSEPLPLSLGYHPYFTLPGVPRDEWRVTIPAASQYVLNAKTLPTGELRDNPYPTPVELKGVVLDDVFTGLRRDPDGFARFSVEGAGKRIVVAYGPKYPVAVVFSPAGRGFICFEPMTAPTNAFNAAQAGWYKDLQSVAPGQSWKESFRISVDGY
jgi:aldose 1-epimerase